MLAENLKKYREERGYSKQRLAKETGLSARCIEHIEYGKAKAPRLSTLEKLADKLGIDITDLIKWKNYTSRQDMG